jgi:hypothetical protein
MLDEGRRRRIGHVTPGQVARVIERLQLVPMKPVLAVREEVQNHERKRNQA